MKKKAISIIFILLLCLSIVSCRQSSENKSVENSNKSGKLENKRKNQESETIIRKDAEELVEVHIKDGIATVRFNLERWEELLNISEYGSIEDIYNEALSISGISTKVKDAAIVQIKELDYLNGLDGTAPTIFLLLEDGSVEWILADIFFATPEHPKLDSYGKLNWIDDIVSLSLENDGEGIGEMTVYGINTEGNKYDLRIPAKFSTLIEGQWIWNISEMDNFSDMYGVLTFTDNKSIVYEIGNLDGSDYTKYLGEYKLSIGEDDLENPGILSLDLTFEESNHSKEMSRKIYGKYFSDLYNLINLKLWPSEGDSLYPNKGQDININEYDFWLGEDPIGGNFGINSSLEEEHIEDYGKHLIDKVSKAKEMVEKHGMDIFETDDRVELPIGMCTEIWLGTNDKNKFTKEILYAISNSGTIYEYDPIEDSWEEVWKN